MNAINHILRQSQGMCDFVCQNVPQIFRPEARQMVNGMLILDAVPQYGDAHPHNCTFRAVGRQIKWEASDGIKACVTWSDGNDEGDLVCWVPKSRPASPAV